jgi:hypothetical protein
MSGTAQTSAARLGIEERQLELTKFLMGDDPLGMVLRAHMHIEEELISHCGGANDCLAGHQSRLAEDR